MTNPETKKQKPKPAPRQKPAARGGRLALLLSLLTLVIVGALVWKGYAYWQSIRSDMQDLQQRMDDSTQLHAELQTSLDKAHQLVRQYPSTDKLDGKLAELDKQTHLLQQTRTSMDQREVALRATIAELRKRIGKPDNRWMVAEAGYLLQLAQVNLQLTGNPTTAIAAMEQAEQRLLDTTDEQWLDIREQLARDRQGLAAVNFPDLKQLSDSISELSAQIPALQARSGKPTTPATDEPVPPKADASTRSWQTLGQEMLSLSRAAIRIRRHDQPVAALITREQEPLLYQNLELILETSRLALLQRDTLLFRDNLQRAKQWILRHFNTRQETAMGMLNSLDELALLELKPKLPDISASLQAFQARRLLLDDQSVPTDSQP